MLSKIRPYAIPLIILLIMVIVFGIIIPDLGFYLDDWPNVFFDKVGGNEATLLFHAIDGRPLKGLYPIMLFDLFGYDPLPWQIFNLTLRFLTVIFFWLVIKNLWPRHELQTGIAAILFSIYPIFAQQPIAVTFFPQWTTYLLVFISFFLMIIGIRKPKYFLVLTLLSLLVSGIGLVVSDYFIALELARPLILWFFLSGDKRKIKSKVVSTGLRFLPYLGVVAGYAIWRWFFAVLPTQDRLEISLLSRLAEYPIKEAINLIVMVVQDFMHILVSAWYKTFEPGMISVEGPVAIGALALIFVVAGFVLFSLRIIKLPTSEGPSTDEEQWKQRIILGFAMIILGAVPGWLIGRQVSDLSGIWNDRFGMASMAGAGLLVVSLTEKAFSSWKWRLIFLASLVGLASGWQIRNLNDYRWSWIIQKRFYNQLLWRVPGLQPDTLILSERELFPKVGVYPTSFAINTIYPQSRDTDQVDYWFLTIPKYFGNDMESFRKGMPVNAGHWQAWFNGQSTNAIVIDYPTDSSHCLWVLGPEDELNPLITDITRTSLKVSEFSRILKDSGNDPSQWDTIGDELPKNWCFYYEKAELARQYDDWVTVQKIWEQSKEFHGDANNGVELSPFIDGFIHLAEFQQATELTQRSKADGYGMKQYLCKIWEKGLAGQELDTDQNTLVNNITSDLDCTWRK